MISLYRCSFSAHLLILAIQLAGLIRFLFKRGLLV